MELIRHKYTALAPLLNERTRRCWAAQNEVGLSTAEMALAESSGECWWMAELQRVRAEELWRSGAIQDAEMGGQQAVATARAQGAKSLELRATISLARLRQSQGKHHETRNTLSDIYHWFTEGFGAKDLQEAKALIEELS